MSRPLSRPVELARDTARIMRQEIGLALRAARLEQGLSRRQLAELSGVNWHTVNSLENARGTSFEAIAQVASALELAVFVEVEPL